MKKAIAALLAVSAALSVSTAVFASEMDILEVNESSSSAVSSEGDIQEELPQEDVNEDGQEESDAVSQPTAIVFGADEDGIVLGDDLLEPGKEYRFPVQLTIEGQDVALSQEHMDSYKFTYAHVSGNSVKNFKIEEDKGVYCLYVETRDTNATKELDSKYRIKLVKKSDNLPVISQEVEFSYGYAEMNGDYVSGLDKGDIIEIDQDYPVITESQFDKIAEINDYKNVTLAGPQWQFTVNVTDEGTKNMLSSNAGIKEVLSKFPEQEFKFFSFSGKPSFSATGTLALDVEDIMDEFDQMYTYRYADGRVYRIKATFNEEDNTLEFRTNRLDSFFVTDKLIKDGTIVSDEESNNSSNGSETDTDKNNPDTGASDLIPAAVMAAIASLSAAGVVKAKKARR